jgi:hypothetical protein
VLDFQGLAECVELVRARRGSLAQTEEAISELPAIVGQNGSDTQRTSALPITQETAPIGRCLYREG